MERTELREILVACERVKRLAAFLFLGREKDRATIKLVKGMVGLAQNAEQSAMIRAGTLMTNNIKKEVLFFFNEESIANRHLLLGVLKQQEPKNAIN